jgi:hypothetical protein
LNACDDGDGAAEPPGGAAGVAGASPGGAAGLADAAGAAGGGQAGGGQAGGAAGGGEAGGGQAGGGAAGGEGADLLERLRAIDGLQVSEGPSTVAGTRWFTLTLDQPVDHDAPTGAHFGQRLTLLHRDERAPTVLATTGYGLFGFADGPRDVELSELLGANLIVVEHRFFEASTPAPPAWQHLTIEQSAADFHHAVEVLKPLYQGKWAGTGTSKGGMTSVYHRHFYPNDVDATVAYVAPQSYGLDDPRYAAFIDQQGDQACRDRLLGVRRAALARRAELVPLMVEAGQAAGVTFAAIDPDLIFEHNVIEASFYFWQYGSPADCATIPAPEAPAADLFDFFAVVTGLGEYLSDQDNALFAGYSYQASTELGVYGPSVARGLEDLLRFPDTFYQSTYLPDVPTTFDPRPMPEVAAWLWAEGERFLFVYGEHDPWSAGAFDLGAANDAYRFIAPGLNHGAKLADLADDDRAQAFAALGAWLGVTPRPAPPPATTTTRAAASARVRGGPRRAERDLLAARPSSGGADARP